MPRVHSPKKAFTLIELLTVIAIISLLASLLFGLGKYAESSKRTGRARGEIALLKTKLEEFRSRYGEYPMAESSSPEEWQKTLYNAMTGRWVYQKNESGVREWNKDLEGDSASNLTKRKPLISDAEIGTDNDTDDTNDRDEAKPGVRFVDPWGHAYQYRYAKLKASTGKADSTWDNPGFLIVSAGVKYHEPFDARTDCFSGDMETTGEVPKDYFEDPTGYRNDNLSNFGEK